jgi:hypothetical protein
MKAIKKRYSKLNSCFYKKALYVAFFLIAFTQNSPIYTQTLGLTQTIEFGNIVMTPSGGGTVTVSTSGIRTGALINLNNNLGLIQPMKFTIGGKTQKFNTLIFTPITLTSGSNTLELVLDRNTVSPPPPYVFSGSIRSITVTVGGTINFQAGKPTGNYINSNALTTFISVY